MASTDLWPLGPSIAIFAAAALVVAVGGIMITRRAESLARLTGLGQAVMGALFLGATTSLSGLVTSLTAAAGGHAALSVSNGIGGIAAQTAFLAIADLAYRKANLEHAAASETNLVQGALLIVLLAIPLLAMLAPPVAMLGVHPASILLLASYVYGVHLISQAHRVPMWRPTQTRETQPPERVSAPRGRRALLRLWLEFATLAVLVGSGGWAIAKSGVAISVHADISQSAVGTIFTAISTSLPELVIAVTAVRAGALTLAVGDIIGGNTFDVLFLCFSDLFYRQGSIYHAATPTQAFWIALSLLMTAVLLTGLLRRQKHGIANIGFESFLVLLLYAGGVATLALWP